MISTAFWKFNSFSIVVTVFHSHIFVELENQHDHWWRLRPSYSRLTTLQMIFPVPHKALKILLTTPFISLRSSTLLTTTSKPGSSIKISSKNRKFYQSDYTLSII